MMHFLVLYQRSTGRLIKLLELGADHAAALAARASEEKQLRNDPDIEVALLSANTLDVLKQTHSRYFKTISELTTELQSAAETSEDMRLCR